MNNNISFNFLFSIESFNMIKGKILEGLNRLTPTQKKVVLITTLIFSGGIFLYLSYRYFFKATKIKANENKNNLNKISSNNISPSNNISSLPKERTIFEKLKENCQSAINEQEKQEPKGFYSEEGGLPDEIENQELKGSEEIHKGQVVGIACCQGRKKEMGDTHLFSHQSFKVKNQEYSFDLFGVFDGYSDSNNQNIASTFIKTKISELLKKSLEESEDPKDLTEETIFKKIEDCFGEIDLACAEDQDLKDDDGTTATVALILNGKIWIANGGNSRTILINQDGKVIQASVDTTLEGVRHQFSPRLTITSYLLDDFKGGHLVLASDGLYEVATTNEVGNAIQKMANNKQSPKEMSTRLVYSAIHQGSKDNVTAIVVKLAS